MTDIPYLKLSQIRRGRTWSSGVLQRASNHIQIVSSTNATPIVVTVEKPHGYSNGAKVRISGHDTNSTANGNHTAQNVTAKSFELESAVGNGVGGRQGIVASSNSGTGYTLSCKFKRDSGDADITPTFAWDDQSIFRFELSLTAVQSTTLTPGTLYFEVKGIDSLNKVITILEGEVQVFDSVMD